MLVPRDLPFIPPVPPDFYSCNPGYGTGVSAVDCVGVANDELLRGADPVDFYLNRADVHQLPFTLVRGDCSLQVELAGPDFTGGGTFAVAPDVIRGMAGFIIHSCPLAHGGYGGYVTHGIATYVSQFEASTDPIIDDFRAGTDLRYLTVTVSNKADPPKKPGDTDPVVAFSLGDVMRQNLRRLWVKGAISGESYARNKAAMGHLYTRGLQMKLGSDMTWWGREAADPANEMTYQCDADLGSPTAVDCAHLEYERLQPAGAPDTVQIGPGLTKVFTSDSCNLVISATSTITLAWSALQTAFESLVNVCIEDPTTPPRGGRAFNGALSLDAYSGKNIFGRRDKRVRATDPITGLNALPPGVNMTVMSHADSAQLACELKAGQQKQPIPSCDQA